MKRLVIAVDCDDVLLPSAEKIVELYNLKFGTSVKLAESQTAGPDWQASREEIGERIYDIQLTEEYLQARPYEDAVDVCRRLAKVHDLHLVTARPGRIMSTTIAMLERYFAGVFQEIEHVGLDGNKGETCQRLQADVLIDDSHKHLKTAQACGVTNRIWFGDYPWQDETLSTSHTARCKDWQEVEREIEKIASK